MKHVGIMVEIGSVKFELDHVFMPLPLFWTQLHLWDLKGQFSYFKKKSTHKSMVSYDSWNLAYLQFCVIIGKVNMSLTIVKFWVKSNLDVLEIQFHIGHISF